MSDEAILIALLAAGDHATLLVYADALEEQGDLPRAEYLRIEHTLRTATAWDAAAHGRVRTDLARRAKQLAKRHESWLVAITCAKVGGTTWEGSSGASEFTARFVEGGQLNYTQSSGTFQNATWKQYGSLVTCEMNKRYAEYTGMRVGTTIVGTAKNVSKATWDWRLELVAGEVVVPAETNHTVYPYTPPRRKKPKKPKKPTSTTAKKPMPATKESKKSKKSKQSPTKRATPVKKAAPKPTKRR